MGLIAKIKSKLGIEVKAGMGYMFGNILINGIAFITMGIFTRILTKPDFATISIYSRYVNFMLVIVGLNLNTAVARAYIDFKDDFKQFLSSNIFLSLISFCVISIIVFLFRDMISELSGLSYLLWAMVLIQSFATFVINFNSARCIVLYKYKQQISIALINTIVGIGLAILFVYLMNSDKYIGKIAGTLAPMVIIGVILFGFIIAKGKTLINLKFWKYALVLSLPIVPHMLAHIILGQSDVILIERFIGEDAAAVYSFAYNIGLILQILLLSINNAWVPWFFKRMKEKDHTSILKNSKILSEIVLFLAVGLIFISPELVRILGPKSYHEGIVLIPIIIVSYIFQYMYTLLVNVQFYEKKNYFIPIGTSIAAALNIVLNIWLIPIHGYEVAALTTLVSYMTLFVMHYLVNTYIIKNKVFKLRFFVSYIGIAIIIGSLFYLVMDIILLRYVIILIAIGFMFMRYKEKILGFFTKDTV